MSQGCDPVPAAEPDGDDARHRVEGHEQQRGGFRAHRVDELEVHEKEGEAEETEAGRADLHRPVLVGKGEGRRPSEKDRTRRRGGRRREGNVLVRGAIGELVDRPARRNEVPETREPQEATAGKGTRKKQEQDGRSSQCGGRGPIGMRAREDRRGERGERAGSGARIAQGAAGAARCHEVQHRGGEAAERGQRRRIVADVDGRREDEEARNHETLEPFGRPGDPAEAVEGAAHRLGVGAVEQREPDEAGDRDCPHTSEIGTASREYQGGRRGEKSQRPELGPQYRAAREGKHGRDRYQKRKRHREERAVLCNGHGRERDHEKGRGTGEHPARDAPGPRGEGGTAGDEDRERVGGEERSRSLSRARGEGSERCASETHAPERLVVFDQGEGGESD